MVHPVLTLLFDLLLIGAAGLVIAAMAQEYLVHREPCVGSTRRRATARNVGVRTARPVRKPVQATGARGVAHRRFAA
jgi:hypothetical protein